jgi:glycosyltransferase involved in cell wall biosynthesis
MGYSGPLPMKHLSKIFNWTLFRYGIIGGGVSVLDILLFNALLYLSGTYYVAAALISNIISFFIRFFLQKHYAFRTPSRENMKRELFQYGILFVVSVGLTALIIFILVDFFRFNPSLAQIIAILLVASVSFFIYRYIIFPIEKKPVRRILLITQKIDLKDPVLGFFHRWTEEFAKNFESVTVICLEKGESKLPENVKVLSLGKEERQSRIQYLIHFYWYILYERNNYDGIFVHMNQQYVILGSVIWKLLHKKIFMWRNHVLGGLQTKLAVRLCDRVFCTSAFSYTARYKKTELMPIGIDTDFFQKKPEISKIPRSILFLSRIAPIKKPDVLLKALAELKKRKVEFVASFYGDPLPKDEKYYQNLLELVRTEGLSLDVVFKKGIPNTETVDIYNAHKIFVNLSPSGLYDKTMFEAMACESLILASNKDLAKVVWSDFIFSDDDVPDLIKKLEKLLDMAESTAKKRGEELRKNVVEHHSLKELMKRLAASIH